jgi:rSAM/selenodomain-associated transferase 2
VAPSISVIVPALDEAARLPRLLDALEACRPAPAEVLVVDGGSSDGTAEAARARARCVTAPRGRAIQQNAGARAAGGDVLWFLHADCVPAPTATAEIAAAIVNGAPGGCFLVAFPLDERDRHPLLPVIERGINARTRWTRTGTGDQGIFVHRDVFRRLGGFPAWPLLEDVALFSRLRASGDPAICRGPVETSARRWLAHGPARTTARMWGLRLAYLAGVPPARLAAHWRLPPPDRPLT